MNIEATNYIVKLATETALTFYKQQLEEEKTRIADKRNKNTKLLLKNYRYLKEHINSIRLEIDELNEIIILDDLNTDSFAIESIKASKRKTLIMLKFVDAMLSIYQDINPKRFDILNETYIIEDRKSTKDLADKYQVTSRNIYKEINLGIIELSNLLYGIDSLHFS